MIFRFCTTIIKRNICSSRVKRLIHQSHKRGTTENGIILGDFSKKTLSRMVNDDVNEYEKIISENDIDLFLWLSSKEDDDKIIPERYRNSLVFRQIRKHIKENDWRIPSEPINN